ncbi:MAG: hypothetical protein H6833_13080 [Planctomycetes bacterium]|nr:hypothetical protein [Planctomycetota bacterium]
MSRWLGVWLATIAGCVAALFLTESALQLAGDLHPGEGRESDRMARAFHEALLRSDESCGESLRPGIQLLWPLRASSEPLAAYRVREPVEIRTNDRGMRMREVTLTKPAQTFRIVCVGDSVTFGWGVPERETYPRLLERSLRNGLAEDKDIEVLNCGVPGHTTLQALRRLEQDVLPLEPDVIVLATGFNDGFVTRQAPDRERLARGDTPEFPTPSWWWRRSRTSHALGLAPRFAAPGSLHRERLPRAERDRARRAIVAAARTRGAQVLLLNVCFPHSVIADELSNLATELDVPYVDARARFLDPRSPSSETTTAAVRALLHVTRGSEEAKLDWLALARPTAPFDGLASLHVQEPLTKDASTVTFLLDRDTFQHVAFVPRSYLEADSAALERLNFLAFHELAHIPEDGLRPGQFDGLGYLATDLPFFSSMLGESVHPGAPGHALIASCLETALRDATRLGAFLR